MNANIISELFLIFGISLIILNYTSKSHKIKNKIVKNKEKIKQIDIVFSKNNFPSKIFEKNFNYIPPFV